VTIWLRGNRRIYLVCQVRYEFMEVIDWLPHIHLYSELGRFRFIIRLLHLADRKDSHFLGMNESFHYILHYDDIRNITF